MLPTTICRLFLSPDAPTGQGQGGAASSGGESAFGGEPAFGGETAFGGEGEPSGVATIEGPGELALGEQRQGEDPGEPAFGGDPAAQPAAKSASPKAAAPAQATPETFTVSDEDRADLEMIYDPRTINGTFERLGQAGIDSLVAIAKQKIVDMDVEDAVEVEPEEPEVPAPQPKPATQQQPAAPVALKFDPADLEALKDTIGDVPYTKVVQPLLQHAEQQAQHIQGLIAYSNKLIAHVNQINESTMLDGLKHPKLGNSMEKLTKAEKGLRKEVLGHARNYLRAEKDASVAQALRYGVGKTFRATAKQEAQAEIRQQVKDRAAQKDTVPQTTNTTQRGGLAPKTREGVVAFLKQALPAMR